ncbi:MAG: nucleotidyltransferase, partial [Bacteroidota bacterium]
FWIWMTDENVSKLMLAIKAFGMGSLGLKKEHFSDPENVIQLGYEPHRIDLLMDVNGVSFQDCFNTKNSIEINGTTINYLNIKDLIIAKKAAGRLQDLADAEQLERILAIEEE